ncbi:MULTISPECIES: hypothetical protein [Gammaproteobacteria]|uniref:hypothetical protein n=1 Tax=Gammaproteobacteria TaxID=1236 RepID=UPI0029C260BE|nr:hypothetical protein [Vibrio cholerae]MDX5050559.1 hypothetical protein [Vibrio cholerae]
MSTITNLMRLMKKMVYSDCEWLRSYEVDALMAFYHHLNDIDKRKLLKQFERLDMMERSSNGKLLQFFDALDTVRKKWPRDIKIGAANPVSGYKLSCTKGSATNLRFVVFLGMGGIGEIQFLKMPTEYNSKAAKVVDIKKILSESSSFCLEGLFTFNGMVSDDEEQNLEDELHK